MSVIKELRVPKFGNGCTEVFDHDFLLEKCKIWNDEYNSFGLEPLVRTTRSLLRGDCTHTVSFIN